VVSIWIAGLPENADRHNLLVSAAGRRLEILYLDPHAVAPRQVNVRVARDFPSGPATLVAQLGGRRVEATFEIG
jgi:hypothetical protein